MDLNAFTAQHSRSDAEWAEIIGIARAHFCNIRNRRRPPTAKIMRSIFDATGGAVTPNDLVLSPEQLAVLTDEDIEP